MGFKGIVLVLGQGDFERSGTGNSDLLGAIVVQEAGRRAERTTAPIPGAHFQCNWRRHGLNGIRLNMVDRALSAAGIRSLGVRSISSVVVQDLFSPAPPQKYRVRLFTRTARKTAYRAVRRSVFLDDGPIVRENSRFLRSSNSF